MMTTKSIMMAKSAMVVKKNPLQGLVSHYFP